MPLVLNVAQILARQRRNERGYWAEGILHGHITREHIHDWLGYESWIQTLKTWKHGRKALHNVPI